MALNLDLSMDFCWASYWASVMVSPKGTVDPRAASWAYSMASTKDRAKAWHLVFSMVSRWACAKALS